MATDTGEQEAEGQTKRNIEVINLDSDDDLEPIGIVEERAKRSKQNEEGEDKEVEVEDVKVKMVEEGRKGNEQGGEERSGEQKSAETEETETGKNAPEVEKDGDIREEEEGERREGGSTERKVKKIRLGEIKKNTKQRNGETDQTEKPRGKKRGKEGLGDNDKDEEEGGKEGEKQKHEEAGSGEKGSVKKNRRKESEKKTKPQDGETNQTEKPRGGKGGKEGLSDNDNEEEERGEEGGRQEHEEAGSGEKRSVKKNRRKESKKTTKTQNGDSEQPENRSEQVKEKEKENDEDEVEITGARNVFGKKLPGRTLYGRLVQGGVFEIPDGACFLAVVPSDTDLHLACRSCVWPVSDGLRRALERRKQAGDSPPPPAYLIAIRQNTYIGVAQLNSPAVINTDTDPPTIPIEWRMLQEIEHAVAFNTNPNSQGKHLADPKYPPYANDGVTMGTMGGLSIVRALCLKGKDPIELIKIFDQIDLDELSRNSRRPPLHPPMAGIPPGGPPQGGEPMGGHGFPPPMPNMGMPPFPPPHFNMHFPPPGHFRPPPPHGRFPIPGTFFRPGGEFAQGPPPSNSAPFDIAVLRSNSGLSAIDMLRSLTENSDVSGGKHRGGPKWAMVLELSFLNNIPQDFLRGALQRAQGHVKFVVPICLTDALDNKTHTLKNKPAAANELKWVKGQLKYILDLCDQRLGALQLRSQDLAFCQSVNAQDTPEYDLARTCECAQRLTGFEPGHVVVLTQNTHQFERVMRRVEERQGGDPGGVGNDERVPVGDLRLVGPREFVDAGGDIEVALRANTYTE